MLGCGIDCDLNTMAEVIGVRQWFGRRHMTLTDRYNQSESRF